MTAPLIAVAVSPRGWADRLHRFVADHGGARIRARVLDGRQALEEPYSVLVVDDLASFLTPRLVADLHRRGSRVLGIFDPAEEQGQVRLRRAGADRVLPITTPPEELLEAVGDLARTVREPPADPPPPPPQDARQVPAAGAAQAHPARGAGRVVAVGGPPGGCGATEVAIALADAAGEHAVVVDADAGAPAVAQRLQLALHPNLRTAVDAVQHWSGALPDTLQRPPRGRFSVLCGAGGAGEPLRGAEVADVVTELAVDHRVVLVDVGHADGPVRGGPAGEVLARADRLVAVGAPSPVGLTRLLRWLADAAAVTTAPAGVTFNRVPAGSFLRAELEAELTRTVRPAHLAFLPEDGRVRRAGWSGRVVPPGPFTRAVRDLAVWLLPEAATARTFHARDPSPRTAAAPSPPRLVERR